MSKGKKLYSPIIVMSIFIIFIMMSSFILSSLNVDSDQTIISEGKLETSIVVVKNIFSREGILDLSSNLSNGFISSQLIVSFIISFAAVGLAYASGLLKHLFSYFSKVRSKNITLFVIAISFALTIFMDYAYIMLFPLVAIFYKYINKSAVLGILVVFIGVTIGQSVGIFYNYTDYLLGVLTELSAVIDVDKNYDFDLYYSIYISLAGFVFIAICLTYIIEKYITPKLPNCEVSYDELVISNRGFIAAVLGFILSLLLVFITLIPSLGGMFLGDSAIWVDRIFGVTAPFNNLFILIFAFVLGVPSCIYGLISGNFKLFNNSSIGFAKQFDNVGYIFVLMVLSSILLFLLDWTNIAAVVVNNLIAVLSVLEISGLPLIVVTFFVIVLMGLLMPGTIEKWSLISPILIPLFMRSNFTPDFAQILFSAADSIGKLITPVFIFFPIMIGFMQKNSSSKISIFSIYKLLIPVFIAMLGIWLFLLILWYVAGLPLGIGTFVFTGI